MFVYYKTHHKQSAEDITSAVFIKSLEGIHTFNSKKGNFSAWVYKIARNSVADHYRSLKPDLDIADAWDLSDDTDILRDTDTMLAIKDIREYFKDLSEMQREILIMRVWQQMSYAEISATLNKTEASCKMQYSRGIKNLREMMPTALYISFLLSQITIYG